MELPKNIEVIFTHKNPDLDARLSLVAVRKYVPGAKNARIALHPANWDGKEMGPNDIAVDMEAGGRGWKGEKDADGKVHSCFSLVMQRYAPTAHLQALRDLIAYVDTGDSQGNVVKALVPGVSNEVRDILSAGGLSVLVAALGTFHGNNNEITVIRRLEEYFEGMLAYYVRRLAAETEADNAELFANGKVALVINGGRNVTYALYGRGVRIVVFKNGYGTGVTREQTETVPMDHGKFIAVVNAAGEEVMNDDGVLIGKKIGDGAKKWFAHSDKFLLASGTPKSPTTFSSKVDPRELAWVAAKLLAEYDAAKKTAI